MILLKVTDEEKKVVLEALHFLARELDDMIKTYSDAETEREIEKLKLLDQIIDVIQLTDRPELTDQKPVC